MKRKKRYPIRLTISKQPELYQFLYTLSDASDDSIAELIRQMVTYFKGKYQSTGWTDQ